MLRVDIGNYSWTERTCWIQLRTMSWLTEHLFLLPRVHSRIAGTGKLKTVFPRYPLGQGSRNAEGLLIRYTGTTPEVRTAFGDKVGHEAPILLVKITVGAAEL